MIEKKVIGNQLHIDRWFYSGPQLNADSEGNVSIIKKMSVGPCEYFEWGITLDGLYYEKYEWCEDDWFKDSSYVKIIEKNELEKEIDEMRRLIKGTSLEYWNRIYDEL